MKMKLFNAALMAALLVPTAASAQTRGIERERSDVREERRELREAQRYGSRADVREERREYRDARRYLRAEKREWQRDRRYQNWRAPFRQQSFRVGVTLRPTYYAPSYRQNWDSRWGIPRAQRNLTYVRHYDDLLLVNARNGRVIQVYRNHFRYR